MGSMMASVRLVRHISKTVAVCAAIQLVIVSGTNQPSKSKEDLQQDLDGFVPELLRCRKLSGLNIAVVRGNETLLTKGYGYADIDTKDDVTEKTLFGIASLSKAFTSALLGKVLSQSSEGYTWDTEIRTILGDSFYFYDSLRTVSATLKDLLTHRMGYPSYNSIRHQSGFDRNALTQKIRFLKPTRPFRAEFKYNNLMYGLLTHVTEVIGGDTWENLMKKHIFQPLGMTSSGFTHQIDLAREDLAKSYLVDYDGSFRQVSPQFHSYWGKIGGSGSIVSNAVDMSKWVKMLLNGGKADDGSDVVPFDVIKDAHTTYMTFQPSSADKAYLRPDAPVSYNHFSYGLAWRIGYYRGWEMIHHTGTSMGYLAQITLVPGLNVGVVSSITGDDPGYTSRRHLHLHTLDLMMGETPWINATTMCDVAQGGTFRSQRTRSKTEIKKGTDLTIYEGTFGDFAFGNVSFYANGTGKLRMAYGDIGLWDMRPNEGQQHSFDAIGTGHVWSFGFWDIVFSHSLDGDTGPMDQVTIHSIESSDPPVFVRGRRMDEVPPPPDLNCPLSEIGHVSSAMAVQLDIWLVIFTLIFIIVNLIRFIQKHGTHLLFKYDKSNLSLKHKLISYRFQKTIQI